MSRMSNRELRLYVVDLVRQTLACPNIPANFHYQDVVAALDLPPVRFDWLPADKLGCRIPGSDQIVINDTISLAERVEFTIYHEIMHILIDRDGEIISQLLEFLDSDSKKFHWAVEDFCQIGAAEFIMPSREYIDLLKQRDWKIDALPEAQKMFRCSLLAAGFQFAHWNPDPCTMVICEPKWQADQRSDRLLADSSATRQFSLHVTYTARGNTKYPVRRYVSVPADHLISQVWLHGESREGHVVPLLTNPVGTMWCEVTRFGNRAFAAFYERPRKWVSERDQCKLDL